MKSTEVPLSSLVRVPLTEETRAALKARGIKSDLTGLSEMGGQSMLIVAAGLDVMFSADDKPDCHTIGYTPGHALCEGCVYATSCWRECAGYLQAHARDELPAPEWAPEAVVLERVAWALDEPDTAHQSPLGRAQPEERVEAPPKRRAPPPPPTRRKKRAPAPPPPRRKR